MTFDVQSFVLGYMVGLMFGVMGLVIKTLIDDHYKN
jgi:hypothetical protein